jgi:hypothetical protein
MDRRYGNYLKKVFLKIKGAVAFLMRQLFAILEQKMELCIGPVFRAAQKPQLCIGINVPVNSVKKMRFSKSLYLKGF